MFNTRRKPDKMHEAIKQAITIIKELRLSTEDAILLVDKLYKSDHLKSDLLRSIFLNV